MKIVKVDDPVEISAGPAAEPPTEAAPDVAATAMSSPGPDYVDQIDNGRASVISPKGDVRMVALADLPSGVKEGHYVAGGQIVPGPADDATPIRDRLSAGDKGGPIALDDKAPAALGTVLPPDQEKKFQEWQATLPKRLQETDDYDLRGFFQKNPGFNIDKPGQHLTDEFKLPNHETFSNESRYYTDATRDQGGTWQPRAGGGYSFIPNNPAMKQRVDEDADGNRVASPVPPSAAAPPSPAPAAAALDTAGTAQPAAVATPATTGAPSAPGVDAVSGGAPVALGALPATAAAAPTPADAYIDSVINGSSEHPGADATPEPTVPKLGPGGLPADSSDLQRMALQGVDAEGKALQGVSDAQEQGRQDAQKAQDDKAELARQQAADLAAQQLYVRQRQTKLDEEDAANLQKARDTVIPDFWDGREGQLVGAAITAGLAGLFGGALAGATGNSVPPNQVLQAVQHNIDTYSQKQKEKVDGLYKYAEQKGLLNDKVRAQYAGELTDLMQQHAYLLQAASDRIGQVADQSKGLVDQAQTKYLQAQLGGKATDILIKARGIDEKNYDAQTHREIADADMIRANAAMAKVHKGAGGGGAAGDVEGLAKAIQVGAPDGKGGMRALTYPEQVAAAKKFGIPVDAKAGRTSLKSVIGETAFDVNQAAKEAKAGAGGAGGLGADRLLSKEANDWRKENGLDATVKKQQELSAVLDEVKNAPHNPLQQALAVEKAVSSARGGAASRQALDLALHHLGGKWDSITSLVQGAKDGELGQKQMDNFIGFMTNQLGTAQKEGKDKYDDYNKWIESQPPAKQEGLKAERGRLFSGVHGFGGATASRDGAGSGQRTVKPTKGKYAGKTVTVDADNNVLSVQ